MNNPISRAVSSVGRKAARAVEVLTDENQGEFTANKKPSLSKGTLRRPVQDVLRKAALAQKNKEALKAAQVRSGPNKKSIT